MNIINKKGFLARDWMIGIILFSGVIGLAVLMALGVGSEYGVQTLDAGFSARYDRLANSTAVISDSFTQLNSPGGMGFLGSFNVIFQSTTSIISLMFSSLLLIPSMIVSIGSDFGIPTVVTAIASIIVIGIITAMLIFVVISFIARGRL